MIRLQVGKAVNEFYKTNNRMECQPLFVDEAIIGLPIIGTCCIITRGKPRPGTSERDGYFYDFFRSPKHHRRSMRLKGYDYTRPGAYFLTLVTHQREELFGKIDNGKMQLSSLGQIAYDEWLRSIGLRREIRLNEDEFVVMPNHIHGIVWIVDPVGADGVRPDDGEGVNQRAKKGASLTPLQDNTSRRLPRSLGSFVAGFKAAVTSRARRELNMTVIWHRNYYDHVIRNEREFLNFWNYIDTNPQKWREDQLQSSAPANPFNQK